MTTVPVTSVLDDALLYSAARVHAMGLPNSSYKAADGSLVRDLHIDLDDLLEGAAGEASVFAICDILTINRDVILTQDVTIYARRVLVGEHGALTLDCTGKSTPTLEILAQSVGIGADGAAGPLEVSRAGNDRKAVEFQFTPDDAEPLAPLWQLGPEATEAKWLELDDANWLRETEQARQHLETMFQVATLLWSDAPRIVEKQLNWIARLGATSRDTAELTAQARALAVSVAADDDKLVVPRLDLNLYKDDADDWLEMLAWREQTFHDIEAAVDRRKIWKEQVEDQEAERRNALELQRGLEQQATLNLERAKLAYRSAAQQVVVQKTELINARYHFETGVVQWKRKETAKAVIKMITGIGEVLVQIPAIVAGAPQLAAMPIAKTAAQLPGTIWKANNTLLRLGMTGAQFAAARLRKSQEMDAAGEDPELLDDNDVIVDDEDRDDAIALLVDGDVDDEDEDFGFEDLFDPENDDGNGNAAAEDLFAKAAAKRQEDLKKAQDKLLGAAAKAGAGVEKVVNAAMSIASISAQAEAMEQTARTILAQGGNATQKALAHIQVTGVDVVTGGSQQWNSLALSIDDMFDHISQLKEIDGGTAYQLAFRELIVRGRVLAETRVAMAEAATKVAEARLRREAAERATEIVRDRYREIGDEEAQRQAVLQLVFNRMLESRRAVFMALESYRRAFEYFALRTGKQVPPLPKMTDTSDRFRLASRKLLSRRLVASELPSNVQTAVGIPVVFDDARTVATLREAGVARVVIPPDHPAFKGWYRVRFSRVRCYLLGVDEKSHVRVELVTDGSFSDKLVDGSTRNFIAAPVHRQFDYANKVIKVDGDIATRFRNDYSTPTPFTTWAVQATAGSGGTAPDMSKVTGLRFEFHGEVVAGS